MKHRTAPKAWKRLAIVLALPLLLGCVSRVVDDTDLAVITLESSINGAETRESTTHGLFLQELRWIVDRGIRPASGIDGLSGGPPPALSEESLTER